MLRHPHGCLLLAPLAGHVSDAAQPAHWATGQSKSYLRYDVLLEELLHAR